MDGHTYVVPGCFFPTNRLVNRSELLIRAPPRHATHTHARTHVRTWLVFSGTLSYVVSLVLSPRWISRVDW